MKLDKFPDDVIKLYNLMDKVDAKDFVILRIETVVYGLPYADIISQELLTKRLENHDYTQRDKTPGF